MTTWEYLVRAYWWDAKKEKYFQNIGGMEQEVSSITNLLNQLGAQGWELVAMHTDVMHASHNALVSMASIQLRGTHNAWETNTSVTTYWAIFKRPKT